MDLILFPPKISFFLKKTMNIIYNLENNLIPHKNTIFLAGGTSRIDVSYSWRKYALKILDSLNFDGNVVIPEPRNNIFFSKHDFDKKEQILWERDMMSRANIIIFWFERCLDKTSHLYLPCLTSNIEFGEWFKSEKTIFGYSKESENMDYLKFICEEQNKICHNSLVNAIGEALVKFSRFQKIWFTSDTHFSQKRTMEFSRRNFPTVELMDRTLISNWNTKVFEKDIVYHLGDFGEPNSFEKLSGKSIKLLRGNYDNDAFILKLKEFDKFGRLEIIDSNTTFDEFNLIHEPENKDNSYFNLFGHIHQLQLVKKYGLNVGIDNFNYFPIDLETIKFYKNAIQNFYDHNVFN